MINETGVIGEVMVGLTNNVTGSLFLTLVLILVIFVIIGSLFRVPIEWQAVYLYPLMIAFMAYSGEFLAIGGVMAMFLGVILAKQFLKI